VALERTLSKLGYASRSQARELIHAGKVAVNDRVVTDPLARVDPAHDRIRVDGVSRPPARWVLVAFNKPRNVVTTRHDPGGRTTVYEFLTGIKEHVVPVGRLDFASTCLLLFTNDTQLANWLTDPHTGTVRRYVVTVRGEFSDASAMRMESGITDDGSSLRARAVRVLKRSKRETHIVVELTEGKNREIRRMMTGLGHDVTRLKRIAFGGVELGDLPPGRWREVPAAEAHAAFPAFAATASNRRHRAPQHSSDTS